MRVEQAFWAKKRVLVTGHTGFKGSWLCAVLKYLNADVFGLALDPSADPNMFDALAMAQEVDDFRGDIRDLPAVVKRFAEVQPEVVFHMAAQPLVLESYNNPHETYDTNVMGTVNVLEALRATESVKSAVVVTTDKVYCDRGWEWGYRESDRLGGHDPYSNSKACAALVTQSYISSFFSGPESPFVAEARAGNVIGGGDWSANRIVPDAVRSIWEESPLEIRNPGAVRPWQHALEPLIGYMILAQHETTAVISNRCFNFGPERSDHVSVEKLLNLINKNCSKGCQWNTHQNSIAPKETHFLSLDNSRAKDCLGWFPRWGVEKAVSLTFDWYKSFYEQEQDVLWEVTREQIGLALN